MAQALLEVERVAAAESAPEDTPGRAHAACRNAHLLQRQPVAGACRALALEHAHEVTPEQLARGVRPRVIRSDARGALHEVRGDLKLAAILGRRQPRLADPGRERPQTCDVPAQQLNLEMPHFPRGDLQVLDFALVDRRDDARAVDFDGTLASLLAHDKALDEAPATDDVDQARARLTVRPLLRVERPRRRRLELEAPVQPVAHLDVRLDSERRIGAHGAQSGAESSLSQREVGRIEIPVADLMRPPADIVALDRERLVEPFPQGFSVLERKLQLDFLGLAGHPETDERATSMNVSNVSMLPGSDLISSTRRQRSSLPSCHERRSSASMTSMIDRSRA